MSVADICGIAGVSRALFEHYFGSKKVFFVALVADTLSQLDKSVGSADGDETSVSIKDYLEFIFGFMRQNPNRAALLEEAVAVPEAKALVAAFDKKALTKIQAEISFDDQSLKVATAIDCWHCMNRQLIARLVSDSSLPSDWAADFSCAMLQSLISNAEK